MRFCSRNPGKYKGHSLLNYGHSVFVGIYKGHSLLNWTKGERDPTPERPKPPIQTLRFVLPSVARLRGKADHLTALAERLGAVDTVLAPGDAQVIVA